MFVGRPTIGGAVTAAEGRDAVSPFRIVLSAAAIKAAAWLNVRWWVRQCPPGGFRSLVPAGRRVTRRGTSPWGMDRSAVRAGPLWSRVDQFRRNALINFFFDIVE